MSDTQFDVVIAAYLIPDLARKDFDAPVKLVAGQQLTVEGVALVTNDADGNVTIDETGDHLGRKGLEIGGGVGLAVGRLSAMSQRSGEVLPPCDQRAGHGLGPDAHPARRW
jgi:hypothetical protein